MKSFIIISSLVLTTASCEKETFSGKAPNPSKAETVTTNASKSVALIDAKIRSINSTSFLKELLILDFSEDKSGNIPIRFSFEETIFSDDGTGFDLKAGDGIFTSTTTFKHTDKVPYLSDQLNRSVLENPIVNQKFIYMDKLQEVITHSERGPVVTLDCDIAWVCGCYGTCCGFVLTNCHFVLGWH